MATLNPLVRARQRAENFVTGVLAKYGMPPLGGQSYGRGNQEVKPPYEYEVSPNWLKSTSKKNAIINNSIEEKVNQTFRRGFTEFQKKFVAKCPECEKKYQSLEPFKLSDDVEDEDVDFSKPRPCPNCDEMNVMETPNQVDKMRAESFFEEANMRDKDDDELAPEAHADVSQTMIDLFREVARDIQIFDDGWLIFERSYRIGENGEAVDWELKNVYRGPPTQMRYSVGDDGKIGGEYWVCLECRSANPDEYRPEKQEGECSNCGNQTYEVYAYMRAEKNSDPEQYFVRGEFAHGSEYEPSFLYGYSPILTVWQESRTLEQMNEWYQEAYENRRAPRGAIIIRSSNADSVRAWNTEQMQKLNADQAHIPTFIDDTDSGGDPLKWQPLLEEPAEMQHMQMREWFLDRIAAKYGVTGVFQTGSASSSGMSQSLEIVVANRSMERLKKVFDDVFLPAVIGQIEAEDWERAVKRPEEEDEQAEAQLTGRKLNNAQVAQQIGLDIEWTEDDNLEIKTATVEAPDEEEGGDDGGLGALLGSDSGEPPEQDAGQTTPTGGRPEEPEEMSGATQTPQNPSTEEPYNRADNSVTTGDGGYSNATYGGEPRDAIDYLEHVQSQLTEENSANGPEKAEKLVSQAETYWSEVEFGPSAEELREAANRSNKRFQSVRRQADADWPEDYNKNKAVRRMYEVMKR